MSEELVEAAGKSVLLVDANPRGYATDMSLSEENFPAVSLYDILKNAKNGFPIDGKELMAKAIVKAQSGLYSIITASSEDINYNDLVTNENDLDIFTKAFAAIDEYDFLIVDTAHKLTSLTKMAAKYTVNAYMPSPQAIQFGLKELFEAFLDDEEMEKIYSFYSLK